MVAYGYKPSGSAQGLAWFGGGPVTEELIAYIPDPMSENGWGYSMSLRVGPSSAGSRDVQGSVYSTDPNPDDKLAQSNVFTASTIMNSGSTGSMYETNLQSVLKMRSGFTYALAADSEDGQTGIGMIEAGAYPGRDNYLLYYATDPSLPPPSTFAESRTSYEGHLAIAVNYEPNVKPDVPRTSSLAPVNGSTQVTTTPTFTGEFRDDNESLPNGMSADTMQSFTIEVRRVDNNAVVWLLEDELSTSTERTNRAFSRTSPALPQGVSLKWRCQTFDQFGIASEFTPYQTFIIGSGYVVASTPTGKLDITNPTFVGTWHHTSLSANAARVRVTNADTGQVIRQYATGVQTTLSPVVANNGTISVTFAQTGFAALPYGANLTFEIAGRDTANNWTGYSAPIPFSVDAAPTTPTNLSPSGGEVWNLRPLVTAVSSDSDDTPATGFVVKAKFKRVSTGVVVGPFDMSLSAGTTDRWELQTSPTHLPAYDTYEWWAYGYDGTVYSGKTTVEASASISSIASFVYTPGPTVSPSYPTEALVLTTDTPQFAWTTPGTTQASYRVLVRDRITHEELYDTNYILSAAQVHEMPSGYLHTDGQYEFAIYVIDSLAQSGHSAFINFDVLYAEPIQLDGVSASLFYGQGDPDPSVVLLRWNKGVLQAGETFVRYRITRVPSDDTPVRVEDADRPTRQLVVARIEDINTVTFEDHRASTGITYIYRVRMYVRKGSDQLGSAITSATIRLDFEHGVLQQVPETGSIPDHRVALKFREDKRIELDVGNTYWRPMNKPKPLVFKSRKFSRPLSGTFILTGDSMEDVEAMVREIEYMAAMSLPLHWKDGRGRNMYCVIDSGSEADQSGGRIRKFEMKLQPIDFPELYQ